MTTAPTPETIGPYLILRRVGRGGMAEVYIAEDAVTGEEHALKLMMRGTTHADRFNQEYEALTRLNHAGIVRVYQYGLHEGAPWFSMEHIAGEPLQSWIRRFGRTGTATRVREILRTGALLADAIDYIHERGLIHRDLKGSNVLVLPDGRVKLLDFGTAHIRDSIRQLTRPGEFIGTLAYASPEQFKGKPFDHRVDLYAFGVLLYRLITGHRPFTSDDPATLARLIVRSQPDPPSKVVENVPPGLEDLVLELLAKKPEARPPTARMVADRLERLLGEPLGLPGWGAAIRRDRLAGREPILRQLRHHLARAGGALLIVGPPGSDRRQVGASLLHDTTGADVTAISIDLATSPDVGAIVSALLRAADAGAAPVDPRVQQAVSALRLLERRGPTVALRNRAGLIAAACSTLVGLLRERGPATLLVDDAHLADPASLDLLGQLRSVAERGHLPTRWVLTADARDVDRIASILKTFPDATRVPLPPLDITGVALRVGAVLDRRPPPTALAREIHAASGGQPRWVEALVSDLVEQGAIRLIGEDGDRVEWDIRADLEIPEAARAAIAQDFLRLTLPMRRILQALALVGSPCHLATLAAAIGWEPEELAAPLTELARRGWIARVDRGIALAEPLIEWVVAERVDPCRLHVFVHLAVAAIAHDAPKREHVALLVALDHREAAARRALEAADLRLDAGEAAEALDVLEEIAHLREVGPNEDADVLAQALLLHAKCLMLVRPIDPSLARSLSGARRLAASPTTRFGVQLTRARLQRTLGHLANHVAQLDAARGAAVDLGDPRARSMVAGLQSDALRLQGRTRDAEEFARHAVELAERAGPIPLAWARITRAANLSALGRFDEAEPLVRDALTDFAPDAQRRGAWAALPTLATILRLRGRYTEALQLLYTQLAAAQIEADLNRLGRAQEHIDEIETLVRKGEQLDVRLAATTVRGRVLIASGHFEAAAVALEDAHERAKASGIPAIAELARALRAEARAALGDLRHAKDQYASAMLGLLGAGDAVALLDGAASRMRALAEVDSAELLGKPVHQYLTRADLAPLHIEQRIAAARHASAQGQRSAARSAALDAQGELDALSEHLDETDRAALRLHPWSRQIRTVLR